MREKRKIFRGALLGLAVGDAMGNAVDRKNLSDICADYGPNGLLGFDLANGDVEVSSYTQLAAYAANGLIMALARSQAYGKSPALVQHVSIALREWAKTQQYSRQEKTCCWLTTMPELKRRHCMDTRMLDALTRETLGTLQAPVYRNDQPSALTEVVPAAMLGCLTEIDQDEIDRLGGEMMALTHGHPETILSAAILTHALSVLLEEPDIGVKALVESAVDAVSLQFGPDFGNMEHIWALLQQAQALAEAKTVAPMEAMEQLRCRTAAEVLAGVLYTCIACGDDFDAAMITAVNHSGRSAAVGAVVGAVLGVRFGEDIVPEFYLESLESVALLQQLADDLAQSSALDQMNRLFDDDWDRKYLHAGI
jgi:ADP-ribosylglycohydrolase